MAIESGKEEARARVKVSKLCVCGQAEHVSTYHEEYPQRGTQHGDGPSQYKQKDEPQQSKDRVRSHRAKKYKV